jgi:hypothetical protein
MSKGDIMLRKAILVTLLLVVVIVPVTAQSAETEAITKSQIVVDLVAILNAVLPYALSGGFAVALLRLRQDPQGMAAIERLGDSVPRPVAELMIKSIDGLNEFFTIIREAIDGEPAAEKEKGSADTQNSFLS